MQDEETIIGVAQDRATGTQTPTDQLKLGQELSFALEEYEQRIQRLQAGLKADGFAGVLVFSPANILWLSGFQTVAHFTFQALFVPANGGPTLITRKVNTVIAGITPTLGRSAFWGPGDDPIAVLADVISKVTSPSDRIALEVDSWSLSVAEYKRLVALSDRDFIDFDRRIEALRIQKSNTEVERARQAAGCAVRGLDAAIKEIRPGATENDLAAAMHEAVFRSGGEYIRAPLVSTGERTKLLFGTWRRRTIVPGDTVLLESAACVDRYHAMITRTSILGEATSAQRQAADAIAAVLSYAESAIRPGARCSEIDDHCRAIVREHGFEPYRHTTAYSVGIAFPPSWWEGDIFDIGPDNREGVIKENMIFHVVPTITVGDSTIMMSETMVVSQNAAASITPYPRKLVEIESM